MQSTRRGTKLRGLWSGREIPNGSDALVEQKYNVEGIDVKTIWMTMIEEEDARVVRELEVQAFDTPDAAWNRLNEYTKEKYQQTFMEFINDPEDPIDFNDPTNYAWTWNKARDGETIRIHVVRMPLIEGAAVGQPQS